MELLRYFLIEYTKEEAQKLRTKQEKSNAIETITESLNSAIDQGDEYSEIQHLIALGNLYADYADFDLSDTMYRRALALARQLDNKNLQILALTNLGLSHKKQDNFEQSYSYYYQAKQIAKSISHEFLLEKIDEHIVELGNMINVEDLLNGSE